MTSDQDQQSDVPFEDNDYIVFRSLLNGFTICDRYYLQGFMDGVYDRPLLCQSGHIDPDLVAMAEEDVRRWNTRELDPKWRGSNLKELGLLSFITRLEVMSDQPNTVDGSNTYGSIGFKFYDAPKYLYYVYQISEKGRAAAQKIIKARF